LTPKILRYLPKYSAHHNNRQPARIKQLTDWQPNERSDLVPLFLIERNFARKLEVSPNGTAEISEITDQESIRWLISFLSMDRKKTFCLYEAASAADIRTAADRAGIPADVIIKIEDEMIPNGYIRRLRPDRND
jgi:hypothetical protein